jgi:hypothetical protein
MAYALTPLLAAVLMCWLGRRVAAEPVSVARARPS